MLAFKSYFVLTVACLALVFGEEVLGQDSEGEITEKKQSEADDAKREDVQDESQEQKDSESKPNLDNNEGNNEKLLGHLADVVDLSHIKKHLEMSKTEQLAQDDVEAIRKGNDVKGIFYFFELHDFDNNNRLDGLELYHALTDYHDQVNEEISEEDKKRELSEEGAIAIIDNLLLKHDLDNDGYVDFMELMNSNPDSLWNRLSSNT